MKDPATMTDEELRIAIAEWCGWAWYRIPPHNRDKPMRGLFHPQILEYPEQAPEWCVRADGSERICNMDYMEREGHVPNYPSDLNAVHEAVKKLTREQYDADEGFSYHLARVVHGDDATDVGWNFYEMQEATARQRCIALVKTIQQ